MRKIGLHPRRAYDSGRPASGEPYGFEGTFSESDPQQRVRAQSSVG